MLLKLNSGKRRKTSGVEIAIIFFFILFSLLTLFPVIYVIAGSFNDGMDYSKGGVILWPRYWTGANYLYVVSDMRIWKAYGVTIARTVLNTALHVLVTFLVAYAMSVSKLRFKNFYYWFMIVTMFFGGGLVPYYVWMSMTGLLDNFLIYVIPGAFSVYNMLVFLAFIRSLPSDLREAALLDGAGEYRIALRVVFPLCKPVLATVILWKVVGNWNNYFDSMYYVMNENLYTLQYVLKIIISELKVENNPLLPPDQAERLTPTVISYAAIVVTMLPVLAVYPALQKQFTKGLLLGSLKG